MFHCYFASIFYSVADVIYIIDFIFYISFYVAYAFVTYSGLYLLSYFGETDFQNSSACLFIYLIYQSTA